MDHSFVSGCCRATRWPGRKVSVLCVRCMLRSWYRFCVARSDASGRCFCPLMLVFVGRRGMLSFSCRFINSSAGLAPQDKGVFLIESRPCLMSWFVAIHFFIIFFTVFTEDSARPLERGYRGDEVVCLKSHSMLKFLNSLDLYCDPLSEITSMGIPWREKTSFMTCMTCLDLASFSSYTSGHKE